jgi:hypothetical protein
VDEEVFASVMNKCALSSMRGPVEKVLIKVNRDDSHCSNLITYSCVLQFQLFHAVTKSLRLKDLMLGSVRRHREGGCSSREQASELSFLRKPRFPRHHPVVSVTLAPPVALFFMNVIGQHPTL